MNYLFLSLLSVVNSVLNQISFWIISSLCNKSGCCLLPWPGGHMPSLQQANLFTCGPFQLFYHFALWHKNAWGGGFSSTLIATSVHIEVARRPQAWSSLWKRLSFNTVRVYKQKTGLCFSLTASHLICFLNWNWKVWSWTGKNVFFFFLQRRNQSSNMFRTIWHSSLWLMG